ncbi:thiol-disulfide oxidoreductase DCC family protein [Thalassobacillus hwangdonensis]
MQKSHVLYDGHCYLCQQSKRIFQKLDWIGKFDWVSLQHYERQFPISEEKSAAIKRELHVILPSGKELSGYGAVAYMLTRCPLTFPLGLIASIPGAGLIGKPLYRFIAKNRYRMFKDKCENGACNIHDR